MLSTPSLNRDATSWIVYLYVSCYFYKNISLFLSVICIIESCYYYYNVYLVWFWDDFLCQIILWDILRWNIHMMYFSVMIYCVELYCDEIFFDGIYILWDVIFCNNFYCVELYCDEIFCDEIYLLWCTFLWWFDVLNYTVMRCSAMKYTYYDVFFCDDLLCWIIL